MMPPMDIREVIGARLREAREQADLSQEGLGQAVGEYLGRPWKRQAVSVAEKGGRDFVATELMVLSLIFKKPISYFFMPIDLEGEIDFPGEREGMAVKEAVTVLLAGEGEYGEAMARSYLELVTPSLLETVDSMGRMSDLLKAQLLFVVENAAIANTRDPVSNDLIRMLKKFAPSEEGKSE